MTTSPLRAARAAGLVTAAIVCGSSHLGVASAHVGHEPPLPSLQKAIPHAVQPDISLRHGWSHNHPGQAFRGIIGMYGGWDWAPGDPGPEPKLTVSEGELPPGLKITSYDTITGVFTDPEPQVYRFTLRMTRGDQTAENRVYLSTEPWDSPSLMTTVAGDGNVMCGINTVHQVHCWGTDRHYALGSLGLAMADRAAPQPVHGIEGKATSIAVGAKHSCARTIDDETYCWGHNSHGQTHFGFAPNDAVGATLVHELPDNITQLDVGDGFTCALADKGVFCWGNDKYVGTGEDHNSYGPKKVNMPEGVKPVDLSVGSHHACVVVARGDVFCWGDNPAGQAGDPAAAYVPVPTKVTNTFGKATSVDTHRDHTCVTNTASQVWCWGSNSENQLGLNAPNTRGVQYPAARSALITDAVADIQTTDTATCVLTKRAAVRCVGAVDHLYDGGDDAPVTPQGWGRGIKSLAASNGTVCVVDHRKLLSCGGDNTYGTVGNNTFDTTPGVHGALQFN